MNGFQERSRFHSCKADANLSSSLSMMSKPQPGNNIIHPSVREMLRESEFKQKRVLEIKAEVKRSFAPQMAEAHGFWHRIMIQCRIRQEIKRRVRAEFSPYTLR